MTSYTWSSAVSGNWSGASNWTPSGVPGSGGGDTATINATGTNYTVTYDESSETLNYLTINSVNATLSFLNTDTLTINTATVLDAGTINITGQGAVLNAGSLTTLAGTTLRIGNGDDLSTYNGTTFFGATLGGLVDLTGNGATFGTSSTPITLTGTIEATGGTGTVNFASLSGSGTFEAAGATLVVTGSPSGTSSQIVISNSAASVFEDTGALYYGNSVSATFLGSNGEFEYSNPSNDSHITFNLTGLNAGPSTTTPTNFFDFGNETVTISSGGSGSGATGSIVMSNGDTLALSGITGVGAQGWAAYAQSDGNGGTEVFLESVCYATGTRILTAGGERPIESLLPGDLVATLSGNDIIERKIIWIGRRHIDLTVHPRPHTVAPIRILRDAIADGVPHADLLVSPDHGVLLDGKLICARRLVNSTTIRQETGLESVTYFHIELDVHAILLAEGAPAESYLDTGNRGFFTNSGAPIQLYPDLTDETAYPTREASSCAPLVSDEDTVRPIWLRLTDRAHALGWTLPTPHLTTDPGLCVVVNGRSMPAVSHQDGRYVFILPPGTAAVRLQSHAARPTDARPWLEDRRRLGVYVARIVLRSGDEVREIPLDHPSLSQGWWAIERQGRSLSRWTDGDALLPLPAVDACTILEVRASVAGLAYAVSERTLELDERARTRSSSSTSFVSRMARTSGGSACGHHALAAA